MKVEEDEYMDIERRETVKAEARKLRKQFLRYKEAEIVYSIQHKKLLELADKAGALYRIDGYVLINTNPILSISEEKADGMEEYLAYSEIIRENIEYDALCERHPYEKEIVDGIVDLILETVISKKDSVLVSGQEYPAALVKSKFLKLNYSHIEYVIGCMRKNTTKVRNIKAYLVAALFNAGSTMGSYYKAEVNHDMPQFAG